MRLEEIKNKITSVSSYSDAFLDHSELCFEINLSKNEIRDDFGRTNGKLPDSIPSFLGLSLPCSFTDFLERWLKKMKVSEDGEVQKEFESLREKLIASYEAGQKEYCINYWGNNFLDVPIVYNQRFLIAKDGHNDIKAFCIVKDITKTRNTDVDNLIEKFKKIAYLDPITKGYNYQKFKTEVLKESKPGSIMYIDIHNFKIINSLCGISIGNKVIKAIWDVILNNIDFIKGEKAAHINADKFVLFYPNEEKKDLEKTIEKLSYEIKNCSIKMDVPVITPFFGIAEWEIGKSIEQSVTEATIAKDKAKESQRTNYLFFDKENSKAFKREKMLLDSFEDALLKKEFKIWFQPKFSSYSEELEGAEALVRWYKGDTVIPPGEFIPLFERNNLIRELDEYVFKSVCEFQKVWMNLGFKVVPVSVNLSRASLYYSGLVERYKKITEFIGLSPEFIPIEITETAEVRNSQVEKSVKMFHEAGFSLQMDDFGSGYSSLATLNTLLFDTIKIDKSLVDFIGTLNGDRLIAHTISLAKELNIKTTAEGVENKSQVHFLKNYGCDTIQGYYYSKPIDLTNFQMLLKKKNILSEERLKIEKGQKVFNFIQNFEKPPICSITLNLTTKEVIDIPNARLFGPFKQITAGNYNEIIDQYVNQLANDDREKFTNFMAMENILKDYENGQMTNFLEYQVESDKKEKIDLRILRYTFRIQEEDDIFCFMKFQILK